jgi:hypothetical protein
LNSVFGKLLKRSFALCCCASCVAHFPERALELRRAKARLQKDETLRTRRGKPGKDEAS